MSDAAVPTSLTDHPAIAHAAFFVQCWRGHDPSDDEITAHYQQDHSFSMTAPAVRKWIETRRKQLDEFAVLVGSQDEELLEDLLPLDDHVASLLALRDRLRFEGPFEFDEPHGDELDALRVKVGLGPH